MTEGEKLFNETHARWMYAWSVIHCFRNTFTDVAPTAAKQLQARSEALYRSVVEDPQWEGLLSDPAEFAKCFDQEKFVMASAEGVLKTSYASLDAAALIFYHSVLDAVAFDYCRVTALIAPEDWEKDLKDMRVPLLEIRNRSYDQVLRAKLEERLAKLERDSLLAKVDRLLARCQPPSDWSPMVGYTFDRKMIEKFDLQRHKIVHGDALGKSFTLFHPSDKNLYYLSQTALYLMGLVKLRYGLQIDSKYVGDFLQRRNQ